MLNRLEERKRIAELLRAYENSRTEARRQSQKDSETLRSEMEEARQKFLEAQERYEEFQLGKMDGDPALREQIREIEQTTPDLRRYEEGMLPDCLPNIITCEATGLPIYEDDEVYGHPEEGPVFLKAAVQPVEGIPVIKPDEDHDGKPL